MAAGTPLAGADALSVTAEPPAPEQRRLILWVEGIASARAHVLAAGWRASCRPSMQ